MSLTSKPKPTFFQYVAAGIGIWATLVVLGIIIAGVLRAFHVEWPL